MGRKGKYSKELKLTIIKRYLKGESALALANEYNMSKSGDSMITEWVNKYKAFGEEGVDTPFKNKTYSKEFKEKVIKEYLAGGMSYNALAIKYNISTHKIVRGWVIKYNQGIEIKDYDPKSEVYTMKERQHLKKDSK